MGCEEWLQSIDGSGALIRYAEALQQKHRRFEDIVNCYVRFRNGRWTIDASFFEDVGVENASHRSLFEDWFARGPSCESKATEGDRLVDAKLLDLFRLDLDEWLHFADSGSGSLSQYRTALRQNYDSVEQICALHLVEQDNKRCLHAQFFEDIGVNNEKHQKLLQATVRIVWATDGSLDDVAANCEASCCVEKHMYPEEFRSWSFAAWLRDVDCGGPELLQYVECLEENYDSVEQLVSLYAMRGCGDACVMDKRFFRDVDIADPEHRHLFEIWFTSRCLPLQDSQSILVDAPVMLPPAPTTNLFETCVQPKEKVEAETCEDEFFSQLSKLYRFDGNTWEEKGLGEAKLLKNTKTGHVRLMMRQENTMKVLCNHLVVRAPPYCELLPSADGDPSWVWTAQDSADEGMQVETFALRFSTSEKAKAFKDAFQHAKQAVTNRSCEGLCQTSRRHPHLATRFGTDFGAWLKAVGIPVGGPGSLFHRYCQALGASHWTPTVEALVDRYLVADPSGGGYGLDCDLFHEMGVQCSEHKQLLEDWLLSDDCEELSLGTHGHLVEDKPIACHPGFRQNCRVEEALSSESCKGREAITTLVVDPANKHEISNACCNNIECAALPEDFREWLLQIDAGGDLAQIYSEALLELYDIPEQIVRLYTEASCPTIWDPLFFEDASICAEHIPHFERWLEAREGAPLSKLRAADSFPVAAAQSTAGACSQRLSESRVDEPRVYVTTPHKLETGPLQGSGSLPLHICPVFFEAVD